MHGRIRLASTFIAIATVACQGGGDDESSPRGATDAKLKHIRVTVAQDSLSFVSPTFIGLSYEKSDLASGLFAADDSELIGLFRGLGTGVLRIGANKVNKVTWDPNGNGAVPGKTAPADIDRLASFVGATSWPVVYGLNVATSTPSQSADEAAYVAKTLGASLLAFEIGNEPDLYHKNGVRPRTYKYSNFKADWRKFADAVRERVPSAVLSGPASAGHYQEYTTKFAADEGNEISMLTQHYYRGDGESATSTLDVLLRADPKLAVETKTLAEAARAAQIPGGLRFDEANSFYHGGASGVSDRFGSALWATEFLFSTSILGASGVNFHGGGKSDYTPIADDGAGQVTGVRPEYYGLALFARAGGGTVLKTTTSVDNGELQAYAVDNGDRLSVILINKSRDTANTVTVEIPGFASAARAWALTAPKLNSKSGITLGGSAIQRDGAWSPTATASLEVIGNPASVNLTVAAASAVLISLDR